MKFNINDYVKVKLTNRGRDIYYHRNDELNKIPNVHFEPEYPKESDGWFKEQFWIIMEIFGGKHMMMGFETPFETDIIICDKEDENKESS